MRYYALEEIINVSQRTVYVVWISLGALYQGVHTVHDLKLHIIFGAFKSVVKLVRYHKRSEDQNEHRDRHSRSVRGEHTNADNYSYYADDKQEVSDNGFHQKLGQQTSEQIEIEQCKYKSRNSTKKQAKTIGFSTPVTIKLAHNHIYIEQAGHCGDFEWARIKRFVRIKSMFIMDMGYGRGYLIPNESIQGREQELVDMVKKQLPETKTKGLKAFA